jgi:glycosyltransferase involved in cell wall biosynthesis
VAAAFPAGLLFAENGERGSDLRIAQIAPLYERVPPELYGGTERVVSFLTEALVREGHDVTLFASGDSKTRARLIAGSRRGLRLDPAVRDPTAHHAVLLERFSRHAHEFDVAHFHIGYLHYPVSRLLGEARVTTLHGRLDLPDLKDVYEAFSDEPVVSISDAQREPLPWLKWEGTVHHGLPAELFRYRPNPDHALAFLGRMSPEKRPDRAIAIARRSGLELRIAAKVDEADRTYFESKIRPLLSSPGIEYIGEVAEADKGALLGSSRALLFPIDWEEPFGLVMIEALACGTPVIAFRRGSVPEIIEDGVTGFIVESVDDAVEAVGRLDEIDRSACRRAFERRFTASRMARDYVQIYRRLARGSEARGASG